MKQLILNIEDGMYPEILKYLRQFPKTIDILGAEPEETKEEEIQFDPFEAAMGAHTKNDNPSIAELKEQVFDIYKPGMK